MLKNSACALTLAVALFLMAPVPAYAYLDPASGSILLQIVLGGLAGGAVILKIFWGRVRGLFGARNAPEPGNDKPSI